MKRPASFSRGRARHDRNFAERRLLLLTFFHPFVAGKLQGFSLVSRVNHGPQKRFAVSRR